MMRHKSSRQVFLFVGCGDVARRKYWPVVERLGGSTALRVDVAEKPGLTEGEQLPWGSVELEARIKSGLYDAIFLLTPPDQHIPQLVDCLELLRESPRPCRVLVEKPLALDPCQARQNLPPLRRLCELPSHALMPRVVDHYAMKPTTRILSANWPTWTKSIGRVQEIVWVSFERSAMHASSAFARGYAREHAVHAWAMLDTVCPPLASAKLADSATTRTWRYRGAPAVCPEETAFIATTTLALECDCDASVSPNVEVTIAAGKGLGTDKKVMILRGNRSTLQVRYNDDEVHVANANEGWSISPLTPSASPTAYQKILRTLVLTPSRADEVTRSLEEAARDVERTDRLLRSAARPLEHASGVSPRDLERIASLGTCKPLSKQDAQPS